MHALTIWPNGRKSLTSNKPLANLDAFKGQKFRVMDSKILIDQFAAVGATAVAINFSELYTSLQTGLIDGQENPLDTITTMKFHEVQKHMVVTEHGVMEDIVLFSKAFWNKLTPEQRDIIAKAFDEVRPKVEDDEGGGAERPRSRRSRRRSSTCASPTRRSARRWATRWRRRRAPATSSAPAPRAPRCSRVYDEERKKLGF